MPLADRLPRLSDRDNRRLAWTLWLASLVAFVAGAWIGLRIQPQVGFSLWLLSAILAFLPFLSARTRHSGKWSR